MLDITKVVLQGIQGEFDKCCVLAEIKKIYNEARIWVRYTYIIGYGNESQMREESREVNALIKNMKWARMKELGYPVCANYKDELGSE